MQALRPPKMGRTLRSALHLFGKSLVAARRVGELISVHVIPRPHGEVDKVIIPKAPKGA